jgi:hypothetical protein
LTIYQTNLGSGRFNFSPALTDSRNPAGAGGDSAASFLLGFPTLIGHDYTFVKPYMRVNEIGTYFADDWHVSQKLTVNYGIRWDYFSPPVEKYDHWANLNVTTGAMDIAGRNGVSAQADVLPYYKNFGPRLGFAYQIHEQTVIRGGFGVFYNSTGSEKINYRFARNVPYGYQSQIQPGDINPGQTISQGFAPLPPIDFAAAAQPAGTVVGVIPNFRPSYSEQFNLGVEQEFTRINTVLKITGLGNLGRRLSNYYNANQPIPGASSPVNGRRPLFPLNPVLGDVTLATSDGLGEYYGLQVVVDKRMSQGLSLLLGYAWAHSIDNVPLEFGGGSAGPTPQDPRFRNLERSNSIIDQRSRLTLSYLYKLPIGKGQALLNYGGPVNWILGNWQTNGLIYTQTGLYFTPVLGTSTTNTGTSSRPNISGPVIYPKKLTGWFSPAAFSTPAQYTYGNASRDSLIGPGRTNLDVSLMKTMPIHERTLFQFRFEAFNVLNHPQFGYPNATIGSAQVGQITSIVGTARNLQASLRFQF